MSLSECFPYRLYDRGRLPIREFDAVEVNDAPSVHDPTGKGPSNSW